ncbi:right-handed parallel beta-helix repeat-containing protein [bacterium]|nr:right-handed parallel beta-helix repeat-containing protein [candidate division CSSED10-310 bacterium]
MNARKVIICVMLSVTVFCGAASSQTYVGGAINVDTTWSPGNNPYITTSSLSVAVGVTLTIEPGVELRFGSGHALSVDGILNAVGTNGDEILFTSGNATPSPGDWQRVYITANSTASVMEYCRIEYAGSSSHPSISWYGAAPYFHHCTVQNGGGAGIRISSDQSASIQDNIISAMNGDGICLTVFNAATVVSNNTITNCSGYAITGAGTISGNVGSSNGINGIKILNTSIYGILHADNTFPYISSGFTVPAGQVFTIEPGSIIKMESGTITVNGDFLANGTIAENIIITSSHDDNFGGDTYNDGSATLPLPGDWQRIYITGNSAASSFSYCYLAYGGSSSYPILHWYGGAPNIQNSIMEYGAGRGLHVASSDATTVIGNQINGMGNDGIRLDNFLPSNTVTDNVITGCSGYAMQASGVVRRNTGSGNGTNGIKLTGSSVYGTLYADNGLVLINNGFNVPVGQTLLVEAGVIIKMESPSISVDGTLTVSGTASEPVVITSIHDDTYGGDTYSDGNAVMPSPADWQRIYITGNSSGSSFSDCILAYGGQSTYPMIHFYGDHPIIQNCTLQNGYAQGIIIVSSAASTISNNTVENMGSDGIVVSSYNPLTEISDNHVTDCGGYAINGFGIVHRNTGTNNAVNGVKIPAAQIIGTAYADNGLLFVSSGFTVPVGEVFIMEAGTILKMETGAITINGTFQSQGTSVSPVVITSIKDDTLGGDTNNDGDASLPVPGDWQRLYISGNSTGSSFNYTVLAYGGQSSYPMIDWRGDSAVITNCTISNAQDTGIYVSASDPVTITGNDIYSLGEHGIHVTNFYSTNQISGNSITGCSEYAIIGFGEMRSNTGSNNGTDGMKVINTSLFGTMYADNDLVYVADGFSIPVGQALTMEPGSILKMESSAINVDGTFTCEGTAMEPVIITSIHDDRYGGDTNNNANAVLPGPGDWQRIFLSGNSTGSTFVHCIIAYGGASTYPMIRWSAENAVLTDSTLEDGYYRGLYMTGTGYSIVCNNIVTGMGGDGLHVSGFHPDNVISDNIVTDCDGYAIFGFGEVRRNDASGNTIDGIRIPSVGVYGTAYSDNQIPFVSQGFTVPVGKSLRWEPGAVLKMESGAISSDGDLILDGSPIRPVVVTSINDDTIMGDSRNDGDTVPPEPGDWQRLYMSGNSSGSVFHHCVIRYAGSSSYPAVVWNGSNPVIQYAVIEKCQATGVQISSATQSVLESVRVDHCGGNGIDFSTGGTNSSLFNCLVFLNSYNGIECPDISIGNCTIADNGGYGIRATSSPSILNSIIWGNTGGAVDGGTPVINATDIQGGWSGSGSGNINQYPEFDPDLPGEYYLDTALKSISPCIDQGAGLSSDTCFSLTGLCLDSTTTAEDLSPDSGMVDMGYHHSIPVPMGTLSGEVTLQRPGVDPPHDSWEIGMDVTLCDAEGDIVYHTFSDTMGCFTVDVKAGLYDVLVKSDHALAAKHEDVDVIESDITPVITFGTLLEGDANDDNYVTSTDFFILRGSYNKVEGEPGYDDRGDLNEDHIVNATDFFLLRNNYNLGGAVCVD